MFSLLFHLHIITLFLSVTSAEQAAGLNDQTKFTAFKRDTDPSGQRSKPSMRRHLTCPLFPNLVLKRINISKCLFFQQDSIFCFRMAYNKPEPQGREILACSLSAQQQQYMLRVELAVLCPGWGYLSICSILTWAVSVYFRQICLFICKTLLTTACPGLQVRTYPSVLQSSGPLSPGKLGKIIFMFLFLF